MQSQRLSRTFEDIGSWCGNMKKVLLLRSQQNKESDEYHLKLKENTICLEPTSIPVLDFGFYIDQLCESIKSINTYSGFVLTSPRAVEAFTKAINSNFPDDSKAKEFISYLNDNNFLIFTVGPATAKAVKNLSLHVLGEQTGNAENLGKFITERRSDIKRPLLFLCGNLVRDTLYDILNTSDIPFEKLIVYKTEPHPMFKDLFKQFIDLHGNPNAIVFFSPSGAEFFLTYIQELVGQFEKIKVIAIGPTTKSGLEKLGCHVHAIASKPTPEKLSESLELVFSQGGD